MSSGPPSEPDRFEAVDWERVTAAESEHLGRNVRAFLAGLGLLAAGFLYDAGGNSLPLVAALEPLDWLLAVSLVAVGSFVAVPLARNPGMTRRYWKRLRSHPLGVASLAYILLFAAVGLVGPLFVTEPTRWVLSRSYQPPVGLSVDTRWLLGSCVGPVVDGRCQGTWRFPLGTTHLGKDMLPFVVLGARTSLQVALVSATIIVPTGVGVGLVAAYAGGRTDAVLMRVAEVLQTVPAIFVYLLFWQWNREYRLLAMIAVFGMASWGGLARLVRNEVLQRRESLFVKAAWTAGADGRQVMRWHLLPNISGPVLTNVTLQIPLLIVTEAALSFIIFRPHERTLGDPTVVSWGQTIFYGVRVADVHPGWWITAIPGVLLVLTVLSFNLFGRALSDVLDPRREH
ncbi:ABC transporter permease [Halorussus sp. AFM4]|uniref:ABC transporter permease n=1 Tax=Halorussus sp. AFM4 TaxID=3421651 RepID=UPI003EB93844